MYHRSIKVRENNFGSFKFMEYIPDVELFCDHLNSPSASCGEENQLAHPVPWLPRSSWDLLGQLVPQWFPEGDSK